MFTQKRRSIIIFIVGLLILVQITSSAKAAPSDPFNGSTPTFDAAPSERINNNSGDWGVSDQSGAATYTMPIAVPPGRNGMAPSLALRYSSNSPLRGGLAVGWTFDIPSIELDHELGVDGGEQFRINLGVSNGRIIGNTVQFDTSNTRVYRYDSDPIESGPDHWVALTTDGVRHYFEEVASEFINGQWLDTKWRLTRQVDPFGNTVEYAWDNITAPNGGHVIDQSLLRIEYSSNADAGLLPHAKVEFEYAKLDVCNDSNVPVGAAVRKGSLQVDGSQKLVSVKTYVRNNQSDGWRLRKEVELTHKLRNSVLYDDPLVVFPTDRPTSTILDCKQNLLRYLTQVDVTAYAPNGTTSTIPAVKFQYNNRLNLNLPVQFPNVPSMEREVTLDVPGYGQAGTSGGNLDGLKSTLLDIDNDGIRDSVTVTEEDLTCKLLWRRGVYGGGFEPETHKAHLPTAPWYREWRGVASSFIDTQEGCSLSGQIAYRSVPANEVNVSGDKWAKGIVSYHFMDYTGDGRLDLITSVWAAGCHWTYDPWATLIINDPVCSFGNPTPSQIGGLATPMTPEEDRGRFLWRVYAGTGDSDDPFLNPVFIDAPKYPTLLIKSPAPMPPATSDEKLDTSYSVQYAVPSLFDIDGDGFLDIIDTKATNLTRVTCGSPLNEILLRGCDWTVYLGNGTGTFPAEADAYVWDVPEVILSLDQGVIGTPCGRRATVNSLLDINGDGLADLVARLSAGQIVYYRNTGTGFDLSPITINSATPLEETQVDCNLTLGGELLDGERHYFIRLLDLDGDGLLDMARFERERGSGEIIVPTKVSARFNLGDRFGDLKPLLYPDVWIKGMRLLSADNNSWHIDTDFTDVNGDGLADLVEWQANSLTYVSSPGIRPASDRLSQVTNGRGMKINFSYETSTNSAIVNRTSTSSLLPYVSWVVDEITVEGGLETPSLKTEYRYVTPKFVPIETPHSRFAGYASTNKTMRFAGVGVQQIQNIYQYDGVPSAGGYKVKTITYKDGKVHQINRQEWLHLAGGAYPTISTSCIVQAVFVSESGCFAQTDHVLRSEKIWQANSGLIVNNQQVKGIGTTPRNGDRTSTYSHKILIGPGAIPDDYRVLLRGTLEQEKNNSGVMVQTGKSETDYNLATGLPDKSRSYFNTTIFAEVDFQFDPATGNLLSLQKPMQHASNGGAGETSQYAYDSHKLFVSQTTNELNHVVKATYDVATGVLVKREGPNKIDPVFTEVVLEPTADSYLSQKEASQNFGSGPIFYAGHEQNNCGGNGLCTNSGLIRFDSSPILGKTIAEARLELHIEETNGGQYPLTLSVTELPNNLNWVESQVKYSNFPQNVQTNGFCDRSISNGADEATWNCGQLTSAVQQWANGVTNNGLIVMRRTNFLAINSWVGFASRENTVVARRPRLIVTVREGPASMVFDTESWQIDGFGRPISHSISVDSTVANGPTYVEKTIEKVTYNDLGYFNTGQPVTILTEQLRDFDDDTSWIPTERSFDGMGRVLGASERFNGVMTPISTIVYNNQGKVHTLTAPDPSNGAATVTYEYSYDSLGRVVNLERPDGTGTTVTYTGLTQVISEDTADGSGGSSTKVYDAFGRLTQVQEAATSSQPAVSNYLYDANDNIRQISDADGTVTVLEHDYLSNRIKISRGDRVWDYLYDLNGNLTSQQSPMPTNANASHYRVDYAYDVLDRIDTTTYFDMRVSSVPAVIPTGPVGSDANVVFLPLVMNGTPASTRTADVIEQTSAIQAIESIQYKYDSGANGIGRLSGVILPVGNIQYGYEARGLPVEEQRSFTLSGIANFSDSQSVERTYNALGQLTHSVWDDGQQWAIVYDSRALVDTVSWFDPATSTLKAVADYERALSGLPLTRGSAFGQVQTFSYDNLARPLTDSVIVNGGSSPLANRNYVYSDSGDLESVVGQTNGVNANANYTYDAQHRLLTAAGPNGYQGEFSYSAAGNVLSADVTWTGSTETRDVAYSYGATDAQAVDHLQDLATNSTYAAFAYDPVGNMTFRRTPEGDTLLHWNALGQVREVEAPNGTETYFYDHSFQRMLLVNEQEGVRFWFNERETHYNLAGVEDLNYLHLSAGGPALARVENGTDIELQYADALQNLMFSLDAAGNVVASLVYGPFGEVVAETGSADHRRQFNGKENDAATGLRYYGYRYYDPLTLRWSSADPLYSFVPDLGLHGPQRMNLYTFSLNNPVRYYDPDGREAKEGDEGDSTPEPEGCNPQSVESDGCDGEESEGEDKKKKASPVITMEELDQAVIQAMKACQDANCTEALLEGLKAACNDDKCRSIIQERYWNVQFDRMMEIQDANAIKGRGPYSNNVKIGNPPPKPQAKSSESWGNIDFAERGLNKVVIELDDNDSTGVKAAKIVGTMVSPLWVAPVALAGQALNEIQSVSCWFGAC